MGTEHILTLLTAILKLTSLFWSFSV